MQLIEKSGWVTIMLFIITDLISVKAFNEGGLKSKVKYKSALNVALGCAQIARRSR